jgi:putative MATE family efflux protein
MATTILVSQYYGAKNYRMVEKVVNNSYALCLIIGAALTIAGIVFGDPVLRLMNAPAENFDMASSYLRISFYSTVLIFLLFAINSVLRGIGDTITPMNFMFIGIGLNIILDPFLIGGFGPFPSHGLNGAAIATLVSQFTTLCLSTIYLNRKGHLVAFHPRNLSLDRHISLLIFKIGLPSIVQQSLVSIGHTFVITLVNGFGAAATNAYGAVGRVDMFAFMPASSMSMAVSALSGQSIGAQKPERVIGIFKSGLTMSCVMTVAISLVAVFLSEPILRMFGLGGDTEVMKVGKSYLLVGTMFIAGGVINGSGHTMITMLLSVLGFWVIRVPFAWLLSRTSLGITGIWVSVVLSYAAGMSASLAYYYSGRWKNAVVTKTADAISLMD